jgi:hypothetical protein
VLEVSGAFVPDITKCSGEGCKAKERCYRFAASDSFRQSYFVDVPGGDETCEYFWETK